MKQLCIALALVFFVPTLKGSSLFEEAKAIFELEPCLQQRSKTLCIYEKLAETSPSRDLMAEERIMGQSTAYTLTVPNNHWKQLWPDASRDEDLVLINQSGHAFVQVDWYPNDTRGYDVVARAELEELADRLQTEPESIRLDAWPWQNDGVFYELCYHTSGNTVECIYSAVANLPGGLLKVYSLAANEGGLIEDIVYLVMSVDIPAPGKKD